MIALTDIHTRSTYGHGNLMWNNGYIDQLKAIDITELNNFRCINNKQQIIGSMWKSRDWWLWNLQKEITHRCNSRLKPSKLIEHFLLCNGSHSSNNLPLFGIPSHPSYSHYLLSQTSRADPTHDHIHPAMTLPVCAKCHDLSEPSWVQCSILQFCGLIP